MSEIVIASLNSGICMAYLEDKRVVEMNFMGEEEEQISLGDIYVGRVQKIVPSLDAAFIDLKPGLSCYYDLKKNKAPIFTNKIGKKPICEGETLLVQVEREAVKTKVPTVSSNLNFTGTHVVLTTGNQNISVSSKIKIPSERDRLKEILGKYGTEKYGFIARTNANHQSEEVISEEILALIQTYEALVQKGSTRTCYTCLQKGESQVLTFIRDVYKEQVTKILVDQETIYEELRGYLGKHFPEKQEQLVYYNDPKFKLEKLYSLETRIQEIFHKKVWMKSGAYLVIEPTEALTVVDVNSGKCVNKKDMEEQYFQINVEAAIEAAHQIRLRNLSGIIIIDFINLKNEEKLKEVLKILREHLQKDRIPTKLVGVTKLQLVEITRKKHYKPLRETLLNSFKQNENIS